MSVVSKETLAHVETVARFFGVDLEWNRHVFRAAANVDGDAFAVVMKSMAEEIERDLRFGITDRIRAQIAASKGKR